MTHAYHIAFSFAGENRDYVKDTATRLKSKGVKVFFDEFVKADLLGKDLFVHFTEVFQHQAQYMAMFISTHYAKTWCEHERRAGQARAFVQPREEYILPLRFDNSDVPGLLPTTGYLDLNVHTPEELADVLLEKLILSGQLEAPYERAPLPIIQMTLSQYAQHLQALLDYETRLFDAAEGAERDAIAERLPELQRRAENPSIAYEEERTRIEHIENVLGLEANHLGNDAIAEAKENAALGHFEVAEDLLKRVMAEADDAKRQAEIKAARAAFALGEIAEQKVRWADAAAYYQQAAQLEPNFDNTRQSWDFLWRTGAYDRALEEAKSLKAMALAEFGADSFQYGISLSCLGISFKALARLEEAAAVMEETLALQEVLFDPDHAEIAILVNNLGTVYDDLGNYTAAEPLYLRAIDIGEKTIGRVDPLFSVRLNNLAGLYRKTGKRDEAEKLYREALQIEAATLGKDHPEYATTLNNLASLLEDRGAYDDAEELYLEAINITRDKLGTAHPFFAFRLSNLAGLYVKSGKPEAAEAHYQQALDTAEAALGEDHPNTKVIRENLRIFRANAE